MGHKISREQIDPGVKDHIMSFVGDINELETNEKSNIIDAVNSLVVDRVDNAENMGKLANAIGEPVTANHSVDEVVEGLGEMLSTFKTNMMNSGVMVESSDKFKQLIDKIQGLTEGEGNKGIQFAEGSTTLGSDNFITVHGLKFKPSIVICQSKYTANDKQYNQIAVFNVLNTDMAKYYYNSASSTGGAGSIVNDTGSGSEMYDDGFKLYYSATIGAIKWYAIGVGEEDTTLRDSLASILQEEGVSVQKKMIWLV